MKATIENLKANRDLFISTLVELFGQEVLVSKMSVLKNQVEFSEMFDKSKEIEDIIEEMRIDTPSRRKTSKTAELLAEMALNRGEEWSSKLGRYIKF